MRHKIVLATSNPGKLREIRRVLGELDVEILSLEDFPSIPEPIEDGGSFQANAHIKAKAYSLATGLWCLADDSGLEVDALGGEPGVHSARYAACNCEPNAPRSVLDQANNALLLDNLQNINGGQRSARFVCVLALAYGNKILAETRGELEGLITNEAAGDNGFGYDPLFLLPQRGVTTAQLDADEKNAISHRGQAVKEFKKLLVKLLDKTQ